MSFDLSMTADDGVLRVRVTGTVETPSSDGGWIEAEEIASKCTASGCRGILLDVRDACLEIGIADRFQGVTAFARYLPAGTRLAVLGAPPALATDGFGADVAANRGLPYRTFDEEDEALAWLRGSG